MWNEKQQLRTITMAIYLYNWELIYRKQSQNHFGDRKLASRQHKKLSPFNIVHWENRRSLQYET